MQPSPQIHAELNKCSALLEEMPQCKSAEDFEDKWQQLLGHLARVWNKCKSHFGKSPKWNGWKGRFEKLRRTDPLLMYLSNARGAHEHTVANITEQTPSSLSITAGPSGSVHIQRLSISPTGIQGQWAGDLVLKFSPEKVIPINVTNRGKPYLVPDTHLGMPLADSSALTLGSSGFKFYKRLVTEAESFFIK